MSNQNFRLQYTFHPVLILLLAALFYASSQATAAHAQFYYGYRGFRPLPVPVPIGPPPYYGVPLGASPFGSSVRIRSPYFSLSVGADLQRRTIVPGSSYRYGTYLAPNSYRAPAYASPSYRVVPSPRSSAIYRSSPPYQTVPSPKLPAQQYAQPNVYTPGNDGGLPNLSRDGIAPIQPSPNPEGPFSRARLEFSAQTLARALQSQGEKGEVWLEYLQPESIEEAARIGVLNNEVSSLLQRFEGITMNPELKEITQTSGFQTTLDQLARWVGTMQGEPSNTVMPETMNEDTVLDEPLLETPSLANEPKNAESKAAETEAGDRESSKSNDDGFEVLPSPVPTPLPAPKTLPSAPLDI